MLNRDEHDTLRQIGLSLAAADPGFAALLRTGQRRLLRCRRRRLLQRALAVAALAAGMWVLRRWPIHQQM